VPGLVPLGVAVGFGWSPDYKVRVLPLRWHLVAEHAAAITGTAAADLRFQDIRPVSAAMARHLEATLDYVDRQLDTPDSALALPLVRAQVLATLAASALAVFPNTTMTTAEVRGPGAVAPSALRRAVAYMEAHAEEPIRLRDIAEAAGTSSRSLQHALAQHYDASPMSYLQQVRLEQAHRDPANVTHACAAPENPTTAASSRRRRSAVTSGALSVACKEVASRCAGPTDATCDTHSPPAQSHWPKPGKGHLPSDRSSP
jgi:AraC-like DNA-binding protein